MLVANDRRSSHESQTASLPNLTGMGDVRPLARCSTCRWRNRWFLVSAHSWKRTLVYQGALVGSHPRHARAIGHLLRIERLEVTGPSISRSDRSPGTRARTCTDS